MIGNHRMRAIELGIALALLVGIMLIPGTGWDWVNAFRPASFGLPAKVWTPPYGLYWLIKPLAWLPPRLGFGLWTALSIAALYAAFPRKWAMILPIPVWMLMAGNLDALVAVGMVLGWYGLQRSKPHFLGTGLTLMSLKPQLSLALALWYLWRSRDIRVLLVPGIVLVLSIVMFGWWPLHWMQSLPDLAWEFHNISLWRWTGAWTLLMWLPAVLVPMSTSRRANVIIATTALAMPYFSIPSLLILLTRIQKWWIYPLACIPALSPWIGLAGYAGAALLPVLVLVDEYRHSIATWLSGRQRPNSLPV